MPPLPQVALKVASVINAAASIAQFVFPAVPNIPPAVMEQGERLHAHISQKSSAELYTSVQEAVDAAANDGSGEQDATGAAHRHLRAFLRDNDPIDDWAGLTRVVPEDGREAGAQQVLWVCRGCLLPGNQQPPAASSGSGAAEVAALHKQLAAAQAGAADEKAKLLAEIKKLRCQLEAVTQGRRVEEVGGSSGGFMCMGKR